MFSISVNLLLVGHSSKKEPDIFFHLLVRIKKLSSGLRCLLFSCSSTLNLNCDLKPCIISQNPMVAQLCRVTGNILLFTWSSRRLLKFFYTNFFISCSDSTWEDESVKKYVLILYPTATLVPVMNTACPISSPMDYTSCLSAN